MIIIIGYKDLGVSYKCSENKFTNRLIYIFTCEPSYSNAIIITKFGLIVNYWSIIIMADHNLSDQSRFVYILYISCGFISNRPQPRSQYILKRGQYMLTYKQYTRRDR